MVGKHCVKTWCSTQGARALSSAEAEYYAMVEGVIRGKGLQNMGRELGMVGMDEEVELKVDEKERSSRTMDIFVDSSAAKGLASKRGVGKVRHMEVKWLWLQEEVRRGRVKVSKVLGTQNPADILTKYMRKKDIVDRLMRMNLEARWIEIKGGIADVGVEMVQRKRQWWRRELTRRIGRYVIFAGASEVGGANLRE